MNFPYTTDIWSLEKIIQVSRQFEQSLTFGIFRILVRALVLRGKGYRLEISSIGKAAYVLCDIRGQFWHGDHWQAFSNARPFHRVVVYKYEALEPDVQSGGNGLEVFRLVLPVRQKAEISAASNISG